MEPLFRLLLRRPPVSQSEDNPSIPLAQASNLQGEMAQAMQTRDVRAALKAAAARFVASPEFIADPAAVPLRAKLQAMEAAWNELEERAQVSKDDALAAILEAFGTPLPDLIANGTLAPLAAALRDSILAIKHLPEEHSRPVEALTRMLRDVEAMLKVNAEAAFPGTGARLRSYRRRSVALPTATDLASILSTRKGDEERRKLEEERAGAHETKTQSTVKLYERLTAAIAELTGLGGEQLNATPQRPVAGVLAAAELRPRAVVAEELSQRRTITQMSALRARTTLASSPEAERPGGTSAPAPLGVTAAITPGAVVATAKRSFIAGSPTFQPLLAGAIGFRLKESAGALLSESTRELLRERGLGITERPLDVIVTRLKAELAELGQALEEAFGKAEHVSLKRIGGALVKIKTVLPTFWNKIVVGGLGGVGPLAWPFPDNRVPKTHGRIAPAGVADLLIVQQHLKRYGAMDIAHIENVLKGEAKVRDHRRLTKTEETTLREVETSTTEERELESTDRFEMRRESEATIKEDASFKAGMSVSGSYGPSVEFSVTAEGSLSRSKEEATKAATTFSKDVTERSSRKLTERILERRALTVVNEVEEKNNHTLNNVGGAGHVVGIYQWVEKVYEAQMFNYGLRQMYDFMVPEPAAYLIQAMGSAHASMLEIDKPLAFTLRPEQITEANYGYWVHLYGASDVTPPPEEYLTKTAEYHAGEGDEKTDYTHSGQIAIDEGYRAIHATFGYVMNIWDNSAKVDLVIGSRTHRWQNGDSWIFSTTLDGERDSIVYGFSTLDVADIAVGIEVKCQRTDRAMNKWRLDTHGKLVNAYAAKLAEYEERLATLQMQAGVVIEGKNPGLNLELMKDELRKHCITILTAQHFDLFDAIDSGPFGTEQVDLYENEAEGPYVRFFEQAFEWEHVTWVTYPYFWGRKSKWAERVAYEDVDPLFNQFLKAGYCRVSVPVRPGFEGAVDHFLTFGEIWSGGPLPAISNPLYLPIADEIAERLDRPGDELPQGGPWEVHVPTTLVYLKADGVLPAWQKDAHGNWAPV